jgi:hypothetical protein
MILFCIQTCLEPKEKALNQCLKNMKAKFDMDSWTEPTLISADTVETMKILIFILIRHKFPNRSQILILFYISI